MSKKIQDKNGKTIKLGDVLKETIHGPSSEVLGHVITQVVKYKSSINRKIIADNGGVGFLTKGNTCPVHGNLENIEIIGTNQHAIPVEVMTGLETK